MKITKLFGGLIKVGVAVGAIGGLVFMSQKSIKKEKDLHDRFREYYELTNQWILNKNEERGVDIFFHENEYKTIAIYGMGTLGELFYKEVKKANIRVVYFIDKNEEELYYGLDNIPVVGFEGIVEQEKVDAIVVTPIYDFDTISENLNEYNLGIKIVNLEEVIFGI